MPNCSVRHLNSQQCGNGRCDISHVRLAHSSAWFDIPAKPQKRNMCIIGIPGAMSGAPCTAIKPAGEKYKLDITAVFLIEAIGGHCLNFIRDGCFRKTMQVKYIHNTGMLT